MGTVEVCAGVDCYGEVTVVPCFCVVIKLKLMANDN